MISRPGNAIKVTYDRVTNIKPRDSEGKVDILKQFAN